MKPYVLLIGYRQDLARALHRLGIAYSVWSDKPMKNKPRGSDQLINKKYPSSATAKDRILQDVHLTVTPTHVIAGTEAGVFPAAILRRLFNARASSVTLLNRCTDKAAMKNYLRKFGIPMTGFVEHLAYLKPASLIAELGLPVVVKSKRGSGGRNIVMAQSAQQLEACMHRQCLYEAYVDAPEGSVETIIDDGKIVFTNITDYVEKKFANIVPARYTDTETEEIESLNRRVIKALKIRWGLTHLEFYRTPAGILFGEIALRPPGGYIMRLIQEAYKFDPWEWLVQVELGLITVPPPRAAACTAGSLLIHPGPGTVCAVTKPTSVDYPSIQRCKIKAKVGDRIDSRVGVGEDLGYFIFSSHQYDQVLADIRRLQATPAVRVEQ